MKKVYWVVLAVVLVVALPIGWYLGSPLFLDDVVDEEMPVFENVEGADEDVGGTLYSASFSGADDFHQVSGMASVISGGDGGRYLRFEDFESTNGPDLKVYLAEDSGAESYVSLGELKGNIGNQNYDVSEVDVEKYHHVLIWCERFSVLFGQADLSA